MKIADFKLERFFAQYEFEAPYLLCSSDCESVTVEQLLNLEPGASEKLHRLWLGYTESSGAPALRQEISRIYTTIRPEQVLVHSGAEEAIFLFMLATLQPGDHVIVHYPCYQSLLELPKSLGCQVTLWQARAENGWALDLAELNHHLRPDTKAVIVNTPHNPTGFLMNRADFLSLNELSLQRGFWLFSDEVYRESEYDPGNRLPAACDVNPLAISLGVTSKTYGLAGLRIGWVATHSVELLKRMAALKDYTTICSSAPSEFLAEIALRHRQQLVQRNLGIITNNLKCLDDFFMRYVEQFSWVRPRAGSIAFPRLLSGNVDRFCHDLVERSGVLLLPGSLFTNSENEHFRLGFGRKNASQALERLETYLRSGNSTTKTS
jgi:aspartate/methionine/tyrosine aminotransferase